MSTFPVFVKYLVRSQTISPENSYSFFRLALFWMIFYFQPLIMQLSPWKCVYPHTSGSRPNHFHNQLLVVEAFLITNIQKYVYFYDFNENVRYNFLFLCFVFSDRQRTCTKRLHCTHIGTIVNKVFGRNRISVTEIVAGSHSQPYQSERS